MKKRSTRLCALLLTLALLLLPAASMAKNVVTVNLSDASPETLAALADALHVNLSDPAFLLQELENQFKTGVANGFMKEVSSSLFRSKDALLVDFTANGKFPVNAVVDLNSGKGEKKEYIVHYVYNEEKKEAANATPGKTEYVFQIEEASIPAGYASTVSANTSGGNGYVRFNTDHGARYMYVPKNSIIIKNVSSLDKDQLVSDKWTFKLPAIIAALRDANLRYAISEGRMEGAGPFTRAEAVRIDDDCADGGCQ